MKKIHINYAALGTNYSNNDSNCGYFNAQKLNSQTAKDIGGFDESVNHNLGSLSKEFLQKHQQHFLYTRGAGYWVWKPYIILNYVKNMNEDDILMYTDSGCHFIHNATPLFNILEQSINKVLVFNLAHEEKDWTKRDCFKKLNCDTQEYADSKQIMSTFFMCKKNDFSINILEQWYEQISDFHMVADDFVSPSVEKNYDSFKEHRHDQSLLSLVSKINKVDTLEDITEWGDPIKRGIPQIIRHTRKRD